jgi:hypothetical protein
MLAKVHVSYQDGVNLRAMNNLNYLKFTKYIDVFFYISSFIIISIIIINLTWTIPWEEHRWVILLLTITNLMIIIIKSYVISKSKS